MAQITLILETVTPLFLAGADGKTPELRPASFRGALRFWWRALLGGVIGDSDLNRLRDQETVVFGNAEAGSPIIVRFGDQPSFQSFRSNRFGVQYLLWSMVRTRRSCFPAGTQFTLTAQTRPGVGSDEPLRNTFAAFWLLAHLGGVGSRARRGGGNVQVVTSSGAIADGLPDLCVKSQTPQHLQKELAAGLKTLRGLVDAPPVASLASPRFDVLHPDVCRIVVLDQTWSSDKRGQGWEKALDAVGQALADFRHERPPEHPIVEQIVSAAAGSGTAPALTGVERAAFGLPLPFYFGSVQRTLERNGINKREARRKAQAVVQPQRSDLDRRASPLMIRAVRLANNQYTIVITFFKARLLERGVRLALKQGRRTLNTVAAPGLDLIDDFLDALCSPGGNYYVAPLLEVDYR